jgi:hypothetical protein
MRRSRAESRNTLRGAKRRRDSARYVPRKRTMRAEGAGASIPSKLGKRAAEVPNRRARSGVTIRGNASLAAPTQA